MDMPASEGQAEIFKEELTRLLQSETLRNSEALRRLLAYLGQAYLDGRNRELKEYSIGRDVMGKPEDYDPRIDSSVRVQISKLRQRIDQHYATEGHAADHQIRLPKGHFELTLGIRPSNGTPSGAGRQSASAKPWQWTSLALGVAVLALLMPYVPVW